MKSDFDEDFHRLRIPSAARSTRQQRILQLSSSIQKKSASDSAPSILIGSYTLTLTNEVGGRNRHPVQVELECHVAICSLNGGDGVWHDGDGGEVIY